MNDEGLEMNNEGLEMNKEGLEMDKEGLEMDEEGLEVVTMNEGFELSTTVIDLKVMIITNRMKLQYLHKPIKLLFQWKLVRMLSVCGI